MTGSEAGVGGMLDVGGWAGRGGVGDEGGGDEETWGWRGGGM